VATFLNGGCVKWIGDLAACQISRPFTRPPVDICRYFQPASFGRTIPPHSAPFRPITPHYTTIFFAPPLPPSSFLLPPPAFLLNSQDHRNHHRSLCGLLHQVFADSISHGIFDKVYVDRILTTRGILDSFSDQDPDLV